VYRAWAAFSGSPLGLRLSRLIAWRLDPHLLRWTRGRVGMAGPIPNLLLGTTGARSGAPRRNGVIYFHDGADVIVIASQAGADRHPSWFHNLCAHPDVTVNGEPFRAAIVQGEEERGRLWALADNVFPPFAGYRAMTAREIPIVRLSPR
jgi:deazaflavin-dependent oxidoreductase (nitroreductase family)